MDARRGRYTKNQKKRTPAFETKAFKRLLQISYREHKTNLFVRAEIQKRIDHNTALLDIVLKENSASMVT